jgi:hypothetical protein
MDFNTWYNEIADMPEEVDGKWVDLETGIPFSRHEREQAPRTSLSDKALDARAVAKMFGGRALKGSKKQKEWAEKIRAEKLREMTDLQAVAACDPNGLLTHSKFWIENRDKSGKEIGEFVEQQKTLLAAYNEARNAGDAEKVARIAGQYNALTNKWGF